METSAAMLLGLAVVLSQWSNLVVARWTLRLLPVWALLLVLSLPKGTRGRLRLPLALTAFVGWCLASHAWSADPGNSTRRLVDLLALVLVGWLTGQVLGAARALQVVARTVRYVLVACVAALVVAPHWATAPGLDGAPGWHGPFPHKNGLGFFCALGVLTLWSAMRPGWARRFWLALVVTLLLGSQSASPLAALAVAAFCMAWHAGRAGGSVRRRLAVDFIGVGFLALVSACAVLSPDVFFAALGRQSSLTGRRAVWTAVEHWIGERPLTGFGFGGVWEDPSPVTLALWRESQFDVFYAHNGYLDIRLQVGLVGLILFLAVLAGLAVATTRPVQPAGQWPLGVLVLLLLTAISESAPFTGNGLLFIALLVGSLGAAGLPAESRRTVVSPGSARGPGNGGGRTLTGPDRHGEPTRARRSRALLRRKGGRLAGDTVWATSIEVLGLVSSAVIMYLITTRLGPGDYGYFVGTQALVAALGMLSYASVSQVVMQSIVRDREDPAAAFARSLGLLVVATALTLALGIGLRPILFPQLSLTIFALFAMAELVGSGIVALVASFLQALDAYRESVAIRLALLGLRSLTVLLLAVGGILSMASLAWCYFLLGLGAAVAVLLRLRQRRGLSVRVARPTGREVRDSMSFAAALLSFSVHEDADKILMVRLADPVAAGLYAAAYRAVQMAVSPLRALVAASHRRFLEHDPDRAGQHLERALNYTRFSAAYGAVASGAVLVAAPLIPLVLGPSYADSVTMVRWLAALAVLRGMGVFAFNGLMGLRSHVQRLVAVGTGATVAAGLSGLLIPALSWRGGAIGTLVGESVFVILCWVTLVHRQRRHDAALGSKVSGDPAEHARMSA